MSLENRACIALINGRPRQCRRWYREDMSLENRAAGSHRLFAAFFHEGLRIEAVELGEPPGSIRNERLQEDTFGNPPNPYTVPFEAKLSGKADSLATTVAEQFGDPCLGHGPILPFWIYITSLYHKT